MSWLHVRPSFMFPSPPLFTVHGMEPASEIFMHSYLFHFNSFFSPKKGIDFFISFHIRRVTRYILPINLASPDWPP